MSVDPHDKLEEVGEEYAPDTEWPLASYAATSAAYASLVATLTAVAHRTGRLPERPSAADLALFGVATHKLSRLLAKAPVASPLRAPFTRFAGTSGPSELHEEVRGHGAQHTVGELLTCPFCLGQWVATGFVFGSIFAPRATRTVASLFAVVALSDYLQFAYARAEQAAS